MSEGEDFLASDEFVILKDTACHLLIGSELQINLYPSVLYLTNRQIYVKPLIPNIDVASIDISGISLYEEKEMNDCLGLAITGKENQLIRIFIPDNQQQKGFTKLLDKLMTESQKSQNQCDSLALSVQRRVIESKSLSEFYQCLEENLDNLVEEPPQMDSQDPAVEILCTLSPAPLRFVDVFNNLISINETFFFTIMVTIIAFFSVVFAVIPFGVFLCGSAFVLITQYGFQLIFSKTPKKLKHLGFDTKFVRQFQGFIDSYEKFYGYFCKRILWGNPRYTLETVMFLLSTALLFAFYDPAFVLTISMFGLGLVERWNPFGFGSLPEIFSSLCQFS